MRVDHIAIKAKDVDKMQQWYEESLGATVERKEKHYVRLQMDNTIITLIDHERYQYGHIGILVKEWGDLPTKGVRTSHRDGTIGVYCFDPEGNVVEYIWYPEKTEGNMGNEDERQSARRGLFRKVYDWGLSFLG